MTSAHEWFKRMHLAADHPEETSALVKEPRSKRRHGSESVTKSEFPESKEKQRGWLREWEDKHDK